MEEFDNLPRTRRPRQYTYRGSYRRPGSIPGGFNPAADVLSAIEAVSYTHLTLPTILLV